MKDRSRQPRPWHVALAPLVPVCGLLSANLVMIPPRAAVASLLVLLAAAVLLWQLLARICRDSRTGALLSTLLLFVALSGTTLQRLASVAGIPPAVGSIVLGVTLAVAVGWLLRAGDRRGEVTRFVNVALVLLALIFVGPIVRVEWTRKELPSVSPLSAFSPNRAPGMLPDIYVFVLDGYGRSDVLRELYGYENPFVGELESLGFVVPARATSNYAQTALAIASLLNLDYIQPLVGDFRHERDDRRLLEQLIQHNRTFSTLRSAGYHIRAYSSEYPLIRPSPVDARLGPLPALTQFDYALYEETAFPWLFTMAGLPRGWEPARWHRRQIRWTLDDLERRGPPDDRPTLVFAHVLLPHPPFVFTARGSSRSTSLPISLNDGFEWRATARNTTESYEAGYVEALKFVNARLKRIIELAIARERTRGRETVIYLQGDHGPGSRLHRDDVGSTDLHERHGILLAARAPHLADAIYPAITPVNALRVVLNAALGSRMASLDDCAYFSTWEEPYAFIDVTERVQ